MATEDMALLRENIEEYVNDENRIVTCKWLSLTLKVHINVAKQALYNFVQDQRKQENGCVNVTYFVAGLNLSSDGNPIHKCVVVPEKDLEEVKSHFKPLTSCHIYSVQKADLKDYTALYTTDYDVIRENHETLDKLKVITCPWLSIKQRVKEEKQQNGAVVETSSTTKAAASASSASTTTELTKSSTNKKKEPKGSIASMFFNSGSKKNDEKKKQPPQKEEKIFDSMKDKAKEKKSGMFAFVNKGAAAKPQKNVQCAPKIDEERKTKKVIEKQVIDSDDDEPKRKRRRRIKNDLFDSSDEEEEDVEEDLNTEREREMSESPVPEERNSDEETGTESAKPVEESEEKHEEVAKDVSKKENGDKNGSARRRKRTRKLVPKQYLDEDGFMVTEKVWESDSTDASDEEKTVSVSDKPCTTSSKASNGGAQKAPSKTKPVTKKVAASPQKNKQTLMMSFFKKK